MSLSKSPFCAYAKLPADRRPEIYAQEVRSRTDRPSQKGASKARYLCSGSESADCATADLGCRPAIAECRYARMIEPVRQASREPKRVREVWCWGEDLCTSESCAPEPRFAYDYA